MLSGREVGVESNLLPGIQLQKLRIQLGLYAFIRIVSESKAEGCIETGPRYIAVRRALAAP